jgi:hypothetical protein
MWLHVVHRLPTLLTGQVAGQVAGFASQPAFWVAANLPPEGGGGGGVQTLLNSHFVLYTLRQSLYTVILNQANVMRELLGTFQSVTLSDAVYYAVYYAVLMMTAGLFWNDLTYKKSTQRLLAAGAISRDTVRALEAVLFVINMVLFQDVDVATG